MTVGSVVYGIFSFSNLSYERACGGSGARSSRSMPGRACDGKTKDDLHGGRAYEQRLVARCRLTRLGWSVRSDNSACEREDKEGIQKLGWRAF
jgi:hypothetical protein